MKIRFAIARRLPMPRLRRIAWQRKLVAEAFDLDIQKLSKTKDKDAIASSKRDRQVELQLLDEEDASVRSEVLIAEARRLEVPIPPIYDSQSIAQEEWEEGIYMYRWALSDLGRAKLREAIRSERRARHEDRIRWLAWATPFIGVIGAITGLVAVLTRK